MSTFDDREKAFESKFAHDEEMLFKARARRNRLFGEWVAEQLGLSGEAATDYASSIHVADLEEEGDEDIYRKVRADLEAASVEVSDHRLEKLMAELEAEAKEQIFSES